MIFFIESETIVKSGELFVLSGVGKQIIIKSNSVIFSKLLKTKKFLLMYLFISKDLTLVKYDFFFFKKFILLI